MEERGRVKFNFKVIAFIIYSDGFIVNRRIRFLSLLGLSFLLIGSRWRFGIIVFKSFLDDIVRYGSENFDFCGVFVVMFFI